MHRGSLRIAVEPQVFDLLIYLLQNRDFSKDDMFASVWGGARGVGVDVDQPHQRRAQGGRRQRARPEADTHHCPQERPMAVAAPCKKSG